MLKLDLELDLLIVCMQHTGKYVRYTTKAIFKLVTIIFKATGAALYSLCASMW
jgi:hypothetical protein